MITQDRLKELFTYEDGYLVRIIRAGRRGHVGDKIGKVGYKGYVNATVDYTLYKVHRLIFLYHHGYLPDQIDHINGNRSDNRFENLRPANATTNAWNSKRMSTSTSGVKGVNWVARLGKWRARCGANGKRTHVGYFNTRKQAAEALRDFRLLVHGEFANNG